MTFENVFGDWCKRKKIDQKKFQIAIVELKKEKEKGLVSQPLVILNASPTKQYVQSGL